MWTQNRPKRVGFSSKTHQPVSIDIPKNAWVPTNHILKTYCPQITVKESFATSRPEPPSQNLLRRYQTLPNPTPYNLCTLTRRITPARNYWLYRKVLQRLRKKLHTNQCSYVNYKKSASCLMPIVVDARCITIFIPYRPYTTTNHSKTKMILLWMTVKQKDTTTMPKETIPQSMLICELQKVCILFNAYCHWRWVYYDIYSIQALYNIQSF